VPPALAALLGLYETGDGVFSPREVRHVGKAAIWPSHPRHAAMSDIRHHFGLALFYRVFPAASPG